MLPGGVKYQCLAVVLLVLSKILYRLGTWWYKVMKAVAAELSKRSQKEADQTLHLLLCNPQLLLLWLFPFSSPDSSFDLPDLLFWLSWSKSLDTSRTGLLRTNTFHRRL